MVCCMGLSWQGALDLIHVVSSCPLPPYASLSLRACCSSRHVNVACSCTRRLMTLQPNIVEMLGEETAGRLRRQWVEEKRWRYNERLALELPSRGCPLRFLESASPLADTPAVDWRWATGCADCLPLDSGCLPTEPCFLLPTDLILYGRISVSWLTYILIILRSILPHSNVL